MPYFLHGKIIQRDFVLFLDVCIFPIQLSEDKRALFLFFFTFVVNEGEVLTDSATWTFLGSRRLLLSLSLGLCSCAVCGLLRPGLRLFITGAWMIGKKDEKRSVEQTAEKQSLLGI